MLSNIDSSLSNIDSSLSNIDSSLSNIDSSLSSIVSSLVDEDDISIYREIATINEDGDLVLKFIIDLVLYELNLEQPELSYCSLPWRRNRSIPFPRSFPYAVLKQDSVWLRKLRETLGAFVDIASMVLWRFEYLIESGLINTSDRNGTWTFDHHSKRIPREVKGWLISGTSSGVE